MQSTLITFLLLLIISIKTTKTNTSFLKTLGKILNNKFFYYNYKI